MIEKKSALILLTHFWNSELLKMFNGFNQYWDTYVLCEEGIDLGTDISEERVLRFRKIDFSPSFYSNCGHSFNIMGAMFSTLSDEFIESHDRIYFCENDVRWNSSDYGYLYDKLEASDFDVLMSIARYKNDPTDDWGWWCGFNNPKLKFELSSVPEEYLMHSLFCFSGFSKKAAKIFKPFYDHVHRPSFLEYFIPTMANVLKLKTDTLENLGLTEEAIWSWQPLDVNRNGENMKIVPNKLYHSIKSDIQFPISK